jgi:trans-aconitate methyltransferase
VSKEAEDLIDWLNPKKGERILDLGCGTGDLTDRISNRGALVIGVDYSKSMLIEAHRKYPSIPFLLADVREFADKGLFDAVFSNAALHWIQPQEKVIAGIFHSLKSGGRIVGELGAEGNVHTIQIVLEAARSHMGYPPIPLPWYFPRLESYTSLLEKYGLKIEIASIFNRPTKIGGERSLYHWIQLFGQDYVNDINNQDLSRFYELVNNFARPTLYQDQAWWVDYKRLRFVARKV